MRNSLYSSSAKASAYPQKERTGIVDANETGKKKFLKFKAATLDRNRPISGYINIQTWRAPRLRHIRGIKLKMSP